MGSSNAEILDDSKIISDEEVEDHTTDSNSDGDTDGNNEAVDFPLPPPSDSSPFHVREVFAYHSHQLYEAKCKGRDSREKSFSLFIAEDGNSAFWTCFRAKCGWKGNTRPFADGKSSYERMNKVTKVKQLRKITEEDLELEPLCSELVTYFAERMISEETLRRNYVMQRLIDDDQGS